jgi:hypothetical protein
MGHIIILFGVTIFPILPRSKIFIAQFSFHNAAREIHSTQYVKQLTFVQQTAKHIPGGA